MALRFVTSGLLLTAAAMQPASRPTASGAPATHAAERPLSLAQRPRLTGAWGGARTALQDAGIRLDFYFNDTMGAQTRGGADTQDGLRNSLTWDLLASFDLERLKLIPGGEILLHAREEYGLNVNPKVAALSDPIDDADVDKSVYIDQLWYQQSWLGRRAQLRFGLLDYQTIIDRNAYANSEDTQFMSTFLDNNNAVVPLPIGQGACLFLNPTDWLGFIIGTADRDARIFRDGFDTAWHDSDDFYGFFQTELRATLPSPRGALPGGYRFGVIYDPRARPVWARLPADRPLPVKLQREDVGFYASLDQMLYRERSDGLEGLGAFVRYGCRRGDYNRIENLVSGGVQYQGLIPRRDEDVLGLAFYSALASPEYQRAVNPLFKDETGIELYYRIQVTPWLALTPDIQYIVNPGGVHTTDDAFVLALRARVTF